MHGAYGREYGFMDEAHRDSAKRNRERGGSTVKVFASSAALHRWQGGGIPTEEELAAWNARYERDFESENKAIDAHHKATNMNEPDPDAWHFANEGGEDVGAPSPDIMARRTPQGAKRSHSTMSADEYCKACESLGIPFKDIAAMLGISVRQEARYSAGQTPVPAPVAKLLRLILAGLLRPDDVRDA